MDHAALSHLQKDFDAVGVNQLETVLKERITEYLKEPRVRNGRKCRGSYRSLAAETGISQSYIHKFHHRNLSICITNLNKLANRFEVKYIVVNFES